MSKVRQAFEIVFSGLKLGLHRWEYPLVRAFFEEFEFPDFREVALQAELLMEKKENGLHLNLAVRGKAEVLCDISNEWFWMPLEQQAEVMVKFGERFDDTSEEVLILPEGEHRLNVAQYFYELSVLAKPLKTVHPAVAEGKKGQDVLARLQALDPENQQTPQSTDPRWEKLKKLLDD